MLESVLWVRPLRGYKSSSGRVYQGENVGPNKVAADDYKVIRRGVPTHFSRVASFSAIPCVWKQIRMLPPLLNQYDTPQF
jgi:hypothetical protein